jgi:sugar phosphate isomerase/epimerase
MFTVGAHLTYCTNIHAGETWEAVFENVRTHVLEVKRRVAPDRPFGVGLRLSAEAATRLRQGTRLQEFQQFLSEHQLYVFTLNGFPYGPFHGRAVKAAVYRPDWTDSERGRYTTDLAEILAQLLPAGLPGSISTVPGGFKRDIRESIQVEQMARQILEQALVLERIAERQGKQLCLALEPEPCCHLETTAEVIEFFEQHLLAPASRDWVAAELCVSRAHAEAIIRRRVGVCLDTCHAAIEFEEADATLDRLRAAGLAISKIQLSTGLRLPELSAPALDALRAFDEPVYLHQVVARAEGGELSRFEDLPAAFESPEARRAEEWRVHFHVPLYRADLGAFKNTQEYLARVLERQRELAVTSHLEVETYTWDVLPPAQRLDSVVGSIARELTWVTDRLRQ